MERMFIKSEKFNGDMGNWNSGKVKDMDQMFYKAKAYKNHDMTGWNVSKVSYHTDFMTGTGNKEPNWK
jgi:hypothetical protein